MNKKEAFEWLDSNKKYLKQEYLKCKRCERALCINVFEHDDKINEIEIEIEVECLCGLQESHFVPR